MILRWGPDVGSSVLELGHAAMPEIGAKIAAISTRKLARAFMQKLGLSPATEQTRLADICGILGRSLPFVWE
jgi:hypothetical protein